MKLIPRSCREHPVATVLIACVLVTAILAMRNLMRPQQDARLTAIRQAGYPVTLVDLAAYYPAVPDAENAAVVYEEVFKTGRLTNSAFDELSKELVVKRGERLPPELCSRMAAIIATNRAVWQLLYSATNCSGSRYPLDFQQGFAMLLPHLATIKRTCSLLSLEGLAHASAGETNEAFAAFNAAFNVGDSLKEEPILISFLVRIACSALASKKLEEALNLAAFSDDQLRRLQERVADAEDQRWPTRALAGERAFGLSIFTERDIRRSFIAPQQASGGGPSALWTQLLISLYRASGLMAKDRTFYLDAMGKSIEFAELAAPERIKAGPPPSMVTSNKFLFFSRMMLPALQRVLDRANENSARMRVAETALGVERFRAAHAGALPENLSQIAPPYLRAVPLDPFDSQPIRYKKLARGYVVYSIGADLHDDGGAEPKPRDKAGSQAKATANDLTFVVERD